MPQNAAGTFALSGKYVIPKRITAHLKNSWWVTIELTVNVHLGRATSVQDVLQYNVICVHTRRYSAGACIFPCNCRHPRQRTTTNPCEK